MTNLNTEPSQTTISLLLVDDHVVVREGIRMRLELEPTLEVIGEASNGQEAVSESKRIRPDVIIMDLQMPIMDGVEAIATIKAAQPDTEIIALTSVLEDNMVVSAVQAGAAGYLLKEGNSDMLIEAIHAAAQGEVRLSPEAQKRLTKEIRSEEMREPLTPRESEVLRWLARGYSNKDIAEQMGVSEMTVKTHVSNTLSKLQLKSRTQAALWAIKYGFVGVDSIVLLREDYD